MDEAYFLVFAVLPVTVSKLHQLMGGMGVRISRIRMACAQMISMPWPGSEPTRKEAALPLFLYPGYPRMP